MTKPACIPQSCWSNVVLGWSPFNRVRSILFSTSLHVIGFSGTKIFPTSSLINCLTRLFESFLWDKFSTISAFRRNKYVLLCPCRWTVGCRRYNVAFAILVKMPKTTHPTFITPWSRSKYGSLDFLEIESSFASSISGLTMIFRSSFSGNCSVSALRTSKCPLNVCLVVS